LYVELTTLKTSLTAEKNRKMRLVKELYPEVNIIMLKKRDYLRLLAKYGYGPLSPGQVPEIDRVLLTATKIQQRVGQIGAQISRDYAGKEPVLVGVLRGVLCFISDLMRHISVPTAIDLMAVSSYEGNGAGAVRILKDLDENIKGRDVILIEDIVDTGMTLNHVIDYLQTKRPASIRVCTLLDKRARRIVNVPLDYVAFEIPDEFVVGYGLDFHQRFRNLPFIAILKHDLLPYPATSPHLVLRHERTRPTGRIPQNSRRGLSSAIADEPQCGFVDKSRFTRATISPASICAKSRAGAT
jgi:hypoxanthine phosphoribosyltransferase